MRHIHQQLTWTGMAAYLDPFSGEDASRCHGIFSPLLFYPSALHPCGQWRVCATRQSTKVSMS